MYIYIHIYIWIEVDGWQMDMDNDEAACGWVILQAAYLAFHDDVPVCVGSVPTISHMCIICTIHSMIIYNTFCMIVYTRVSTYIYI